MCEHAESSTGPVWASKQDARITPVGLFLRRTRLDELPQLWNIVCGDMSIVGPRPERPEFVSALTEQIPFYAQRHIVKSGLTAWAQIRYSYGRERPGRDGETAVRLVLHQAHVDAAGPDDHGQIQPSLELHAGDAG
jgi:lipopolysaccharide/colanic/teichoic acid biosynthesis glycosyltransferase